MVSVKKYAIVASMATCLALSGSLFASPLLTKGSTGNYVMTNGGPLSPVEITYATASFSSASCIFAASTPSSLISTTSWSGPPILFPSSPLPSDMISLNASAIPAATASVLLVLYGKVNTTQVSAYVCFNIHNPPSPAFKNAMFSAVP